MSNVTLNCCDCLQYLKAQPSNSVDLIFTSPPYGKARSYGELSFNLTGGDWVDWCVERWIECDRICKGLVAWVVEGQTKKFQWDATPALLMAKLHSRGIKLRKPPVFHRFGIPGSGGNDWLRNDWEFVVCSSKGKLPWSDPTACGEPPKYSPGGKMSHRIKDGSRVGGGSPNGCKGGDLAKTRDYVPPKLANPGNVIRLAVGGGRMGDKLCHLNEAPFPDELARFFVKSFCPPGGICLDPFMGSETTGAVCVQEGRHFHGVDVRQSQVDLAHQRISKVLVS